MDATSGLHDLLQGRIGKKWRHQEPVRSQSGRHMDVRFSYCESQRDSILPEHEDASHQQSCDDSRCDDEEYQDSVADPQTNSTVRGTRPSDDVTSTRHAKKNIDGIQHVSGRKSARRRSGDAAVDADARISSRGSNRCRSEGARSTKTLSPGSRASASTRDRDCVDDQEIVASRRSELLDDPYEMDSTENRICDDSPRADIDVRGNGSASRRRSNDGAKRVAFSDDVSTRYEDGEDHGFVEAGCSRSSHRLSRGVSRSTDADIRKDRDEMDADFLEDFADGNHSGRCQRRCTPWPSSPLKPIEGSDDDVVDQGSSVQARQRQTAEQQPRSSQRESSTRVRCSSRQSRAKETMNSEFHSASPRANDLSSGRDIAVRASDRASTGGHYPRLLGGTVVGESDMKEKKSIRANVTSQDLQQSDGRRQAFDLDAFDGDASSKQTGVRRDAEAEGISSRTRSTLANRSSQSLEPEMDRAEINSRLTSVTDQRSSGQTSSRFPRSHSVDVDVSQQQLLSSRGSHVRLESQQTRRTDVEREETRCSNQVFDKHDTVHQKLSRVDEQTGDRQSVLDVCTRQSAAAEDGGARDSDDVRRTGCASQHVETAWEKHQLDVSMRGGCEQRKCSTFDSADVEAIEADSSKPSDEGKLFEEVETSLSARGIQSERQTKTIVDRGSSCDARRSSQRHVARSTKMLSRRDDSREGDSAYTKMSEHRLESSVVDAETCAGTGQEASQRDTSLLRSRSTGSACQRNNHERSHGSSRRSDAMNTRRSSRKTKPDRADATDTIEEKDSPSATSAYGYAKTEDTLEQARQLSEQGQSFDDCSSTPNTQILRVPSACLNKDASSSRSGSVEHRRKQENTSEHRNFQEMGERRLEETSVGVSEIVRPTAAERRLFADQEEVSKKNLRGRKSVDDRCSTSSCRLPSKDHFSNCTHSSDETLVLVSKSDNLACAGSSSEDTAVLLNDWERKLEKTQMEQSFACSASRSQQVVERQHSSAPQRESSASRRGTDARKCRTSEAATAGSQLCRSDERTVQSVMQRPPETNLEGVVDQSDSEATYTVRTSDDENDASSPSAGISEMRETRLLHGEGALREKSTAVSGHASRVCSRSAKSSRQATATSTRGISCDPHRSSVQPQQATSTKSCAFGPMDVNRSAKVSNVVQRCTDVHESQDAQFGRASCRYNRRGDPDYVGLDAELPRSSHQVSKRVVELHGSERSRVQLQLEQADEALAAISNAKQASEQARTASVQLPTILSRICREFAVHFLATVDAPIGELPVAVDGVPAILAMLVRIVSLLDVLVAHDGGDSCSGGSRHLASSVGAAATDAAVRALSDSAGLGGVLPLCVRIMRAEGRSLPAPSSNELLLHAVITVRLLVEWMPPIGVPRPRGQLSTLGAHDALVSVALTLQHDLAGEKHSVSGQRSQDVDATSCEEAMTTKFAQLALALDTLVICTSSQEFAADFANGRSFSSGRKLKDARSSREADLPRTFIEISADVLEHVASIPFSLNACSTGGGTLSVAIDAATASSIRLVATAVSLHQHEALSETNCHRVATSLSSILAERPLTLRLAVALRDLVCTASPASRGNWFRNRVVHTDNTFKELLRSMAAEGVAAGCVRAVRHSLEVARAAQSDFEDESQDGSCSQASALVGQGVQAAAAGAAAHVALFGALYGHVEVVVRGVEGSGSNHRGSDASAELERIVKDGKMESSNVDDACMVELTASQVNRKGAVEGALRSLRRSIRMTCMAPYLRR